jgi:hypothetical protein
MAGLLRMALPIRPLSADQLTCGHALVWFRRGLRDFNHAARAHALKSAQAAGTPADAPPAR